MSAVTIGLTFPGTCEKAFNLYKSVFGGEFKDFIRYKDHAFTDEGTPVKDKEKIAYVALVIGGVLVTGDDTLDSSGVKLSSGNLVGITYEPYSKEEADRAFRALAEGGKVISPNTDYPWGRCGGVIDRFGVKWGFFYRTPENKPRISRKTPNKQPR